MGLQAPDWDRTQLVQRAGSQHGPWRVAVTSWTEGRARLVCVGMTERFGKENCPADPEGDDKRLFLS